MQLDDIYDQLAYGELRQLVIGSGAIDATEIGVPKEAYQRLLPLVKSGLTELHKRFLLREQEFTLELQTGKVSYNLTYDYAQSNLKSTESPKYINDSGEAYEDNLMRVERVYGTYKAEEYLLPLNQLSNPEALRTPRYNTLVIPSDEEKALWLKETTQLRVVFRADHPSIRDITANANPGRTTIYLPSTYLEALTFYIASRITNPQGSAGEFHDGNNYAMKFEAAVAQLKNTNYDLDEDSDHEKLTFRGFV